MYRHSPGLLLVDATKSNSAEPSHCETVDMPRTNSSIAGHEPGTPPVQFCHMHLACTEMSAANCKRLRSLAKKPFATCGESRAVSFVHKDSANRIEAGNASANILQSGGQHGVSREHCYSINQDQVSARIICPFQFFIMRSWYSEFSLKE